MDLDTQTTNERPYKGLVGDIGGTNARFAIAIRQNGATILNDFQSVECSNFADFYEALRVYFDRIGGKPELDFCVLAMAGPVKDGAIELTNLPWTITEVELANQTGAKIARLVNDFAGLAYCLPHLQGADTLPIGTPIKGASNVFAVMGAGTGFGASVLVGGANGPYCLPTESGHATFAPVNDFEIEIYRYLRKKYGRVSIEHLMSGPGLVNLYTSISHIRGEPHKALTPAQITDIDGTDAQGCRHTIDAFIDILASVAGDLALLHGALSGIFIAGGIINHVIDKIDHQRFRARMEAKGPMTNLVKAIPSKIIINPHAALIGAANVLTINQILEA
jgi:glucokinase